MNKTDYKIDSKGSLAILALGDIGLREWRKVKKIEREKEKSKNEKK